jgi:hypothetical protein
MKCACGSSDIRAIKPGVDALYVPGGLIPIEHAVADQFTCRACFTKTQRKESTMTDRLVIEVTGDLPDEGKYAILASAEVMARDMVDKLQSEHVGLPDPKISVKAVRPTTKKAAPVQPVTAPPHSRHAGD